jgi:hypothetical protein
MNILTLCSPVVTICTTSLTFNNSTFCPHSVFMCSVCISEQAAIISLYNINWLAFIAETVCVYCAVRTGSLNARILQVNVSLQMFNHVTGYLFVSVWFQQTAPADNSPSVSTKFAFIENFYRCVCIPFSWRSPLPSAHNTNITSTVDVITSI